MEGVIQNKSPLMRPKKIKSKINKRAILLLFVVMVAYATLSTSAPVSADTLLIPDRNARQTAAKGVERPARGLNMGEVQEQFGSPIEVNGPIGDPPITRWMYEKFTVVFEGDIVIHSFVKD